ncbi:hypothetical protein EYZ11_002089 [Aspergillus tanneri]|uniref:Uncharacterized protein n=1 Tax=Aspergillus tanneri TaxID=1220188 RepID=A0A4S3JSF4_9EURO|nr:hypothetical protein EYZ11_002089 [Aspergillus tanneri]
MPYLIVILIISSSYASDYSPTGEVGPLAPEEQPVATCFGVGDRISLMPEEPAERLSDALGRLIHDLRGERKSGS